MAIKLYGPGERKGNKFWLAIGHDEAGKYVERSTKCRTKRDAEAWLKTFLKGKQPTAARPVRVAAPVQPQLPLSTAHTMGEAVVKYAESRGLDLDYLPAPSILRGGSPFTQAQRDEIPRLRRLRDELGERPVGAVVPDEVISLAHRALPGAKPATKDREVITPAASVLTYARKMLGWREKPADIPRFGNDTVRTRVVNPEAEAALIEATQTPMQRLLLLWLFCQGTRITETLKVRWAADSDDEGVDLDRRLVRMVVKGGAMKTFALADELVEELQKIPAAERQGRVFPWGGDRHRVYRWLTKKAAALGVRFTPHVARHTLGTRSNEAGNGMRTTMDLLGHTDHRSSLRYQSSNIEVSRLAVNALRRKTGKASDAA